MPAPPAQEATSEQHALAATHMLKLMENCRVTPGSKCSNAACHKCAEPSRQVAFKTVLYLDGEAEGCGGCAIQVRAGAFTTPKCIGTWVCMACDKAKVHRERAGGLQNIWLHLQTKIHFHAMQINRGQAKPGSSVNVNSHKAWLKSIGEKSTKAERTTFLNVGKKRARSQTPEEVASPPTCSGSNLPSFNGLAAGSPHPLLENTAFSGFTTAAKSGAQEAAAALAAQEQAAEVNHYGGPRYVNQA
jgi:hypothetical protein